MSRMEEQETFVFLGSNVFKSSQSGRFFQGNLKGRVEKKLMLVILQVVICFNLLILNSFLNIVANANSLNKNNVCLQL